jgi:Protein of unknown function (DUF2934)
MRPTRDQIERAAYDRWIRRDRAHGHDRDDWIGSETELTFLLNYNTVVEYPLDSSTSLILGDSIRCRFCERTSPHATFSRPRPVVQGPAERVLFSAQVCDECQQDCRDPIAIHCERFWKALHAGGDVHRRVQRRDVDALAVLKSLVTSALLIMPENELAYFADTLDWVNNPDHEYDGGLFTDTFAQVYDAPFLREQSSIALARRIDDEAPFPYMISFLSWRGIVIQISLPMSVRDQDLDGRSEQAAQRSLISGDGRGYYEARPAVLRLVEHVRRPRAEYSSAEASSDSVDCSPRFTCGAAGSWQRSHPTT